MEHLSLSEEVKQFYLPFSDILNIHNTNNLYSNYYEMNQPFSIQMCTNHPEDIASSYRMLLLSPDVQHFVTIPRKIISANSQHPMHLINHAKLMYVLEGKVYQILEGKHILYNPGSCCLINQNIWHTEGFDTDYQIVFFTISPNFLERLMNYNNSFLFSRENEYSSNSILDYLLQSTKSLEIEKTYIDFFPVIYEESQKLKMHNIFEEMMHTLLESNYGATFHLQYLFYQLINILSNPEYYHTNKIHLKSNTESIIFSRITQLFEDTNGRIRRSEIEHYLSYSGSYLSRIVKKQTGMTLFDYGMSFSLRAAKDMLQNTDKSIKDIMQELNFTNASHFYKIFEENFGVTPKEYRNQFKNQDSIK